MGYFSQRDFMRLLYGRHRGHERGIVLDYAKGERDGWVDRWSEQDRLSPEEYARRLLRDGLAQGWMFRR